jgi:thiol-disulfide isomerase/thioredoxin
MLPLGTTLPSFSLPDLDGRLIGDREFADAKALVVAFFCPHCPYVKHVRQVFARLAHDYQRQGVAVVAINFERR